MTVFCRYFIADFFLQSAIIAAHYSTMKQLKTIERKTLHYLVLGSPISEIAQRLDRSEKTINDYRRTLMSYFEATDLATLFKSAFLYGYCDDILHNLDTLRVGKNFQRLKIPEIVLIHELVKGKEFAELAIKFNLNLKDIKDQFETVRNKLEIKKNEDLFLNALAAGYIRLTLSDTEKLSKETVDTSVKQWIVGKTVLKVPKYDLSYEYFT